MTNWGRVYIMLAVVGVLIILVPSIWIYGLIDKTTKEVQQSSEQESIANKENIETLNSLIDKDYTVYCDGVEVKLKGTENPGQFIIDNYSYIINDIDKLINITNKEKVEYRNNNTITPIVIPIK